METIVKYDTAEQTQKKKIVLWNMKGLFLPDFSFVGLDILSFLLDCCLHKLSVAKIKSLQ